MSKYCSLCNSQDFKYYKYLSFSKKNFYIFHFFLFYIYKIIPFALIKFLPTKIKTIISWGIWKPNSKIKRCNSCGFGILENIPNKYSLEYWYENEGQTSSLGSKRLLRAQSQFNFINDNLNLNKIGSILDYGCGNYPDLIEMVNIKNNKININVSDISKSTTEMLSKKKFISKAYQVFQPKDIPGKFDLIILSHIINNVMDSFIFIKEINSLLNNDGYLLAEIKNCNLDYFENCKKHFPFFNFFNSSAFQKMLSNFDFDIIKLKYYGPSNQSFFNGADKTYEESENGIFLRYLLKKNIPY